MQRARFRIALVSAAALTAALGAASVSAQTTMAPTAGPVVGPSSAPSPSNPPLKTMAPMTKPGGAMMPSPAGTLALDARYLRAHRTRTGYTLTGQALVKDACQAARFDRFLGNIFPPQFDLNQFRRTGTMNLLCIQRLTWVTAAPRAVTSSAPPRFVTVRTAKGSVRVPVS